MNFNLTMNFYCKTNSLGKSRKYGVFKLILVLEDINPKNSRNVLTAEYVNFDNFTMIFKIAKVNSQTKMTKSTTQKMTTVY